MDFFKDEFVPQIQGAQYHPRWVKANPGEAAKWNDFRDKVLAFEKGDPAPELPTMQTKYGKALVAAGKLAVSVTDIGAYYPTPGVVTFTTNISEGQTISTPFLWTASADPQADSMEFWADGALLVTDTSAPFQHTLTLPEGQHDLGLGAFHGATRTLYDPNNLGRFARVTVDNDSTSGTEHNIQTFADIVSNSWGQPYVNRWYTTGNSYQPPPSSGNWPSIGGEAITQISTPQGPGFRFRINGEMRAFSAGAMAVMLHDQNHYIPHTNFLGRTQELQFKIMFPSSANGATFWNTGYDDFNALMECVGDSNVSNQIGINASGRFYCRSYGHIQSGKAVGPQIQRDVWYTHRWIKKWSWGADGLTQWYVNGVKYADWPGASLQPNTNINSFMFGFYTYPFAAQATTEIHYAGMKFIDYS